MNCFASDSNLTGYRRGGTQPQHQPSYGTAIGQHSGKEPNGLEADLKVWRFAVCAGGGSSSLCQSRMPLLQVSEPSVDSEIWGSVFLGGYFS